MLRRGAGAARDAEGAESRVASTACRIGGNSFSPDTPVATPDGERAIGTLQVGDQVTAYDPQTGKASAQMVEHIWINHDTDLIDLTLRTVSDTGSHAAHDASGKQQDAELAAHGLRAPPADEQIAQQAEAARQGQTDAVTGAAPHASGARSTAPADETVHTTYKHPWLTADRGWVKAGQLRLGERVVRLDGTMAVVAAERAVLGAADYYNLEVSHLHTFAVGEGRYVVHNCDEAFLTNGKKVNISREGDGFKHSFKHAAEWLGKPKSELTEGDKDLWHTAIRENLNSKKIFLWSSKKTPTVAVLGRLEGRPFVMQFERDGENLVTAFIPKPKQLYAMLRRYRGQI